MTRTEQEPLPYTLRRRLDRDATLAEVRRLRGPDTTPADRAAWAERVGRAHGNLDLQTHE